MTFLIQAIANTNLELFNFNKSPRRATLPLDYASNITKTAMHDQFKSTWLSVDLNERLLDLSEDGY